MRYNAVQIKAWCTKCQVTFKVDLVALIIAKGLDYWFNWQHPPCRVYDCDGRCNFLVSASEGMPMVTLDRWTKD